MSFDDFIKQLFKDQYGDAIQSEITVGALEKSFDLWVLGKHPQIQNSTIIPEQFKEYGDNIIEYKSSHDNYSIRDILKLLGDASYFAFNRKKNLHYTFHNSCLWFIVVNPNPFSKSFKENGFVQSETPGIYHYPDYLPKIRVIVINELEPEKEENSLLLLLSSGESFRKFLHVLLERKSLARYMQKYIFKKCLIEDEELKDMVEVQKFKKKYSVEENIRSAVKDLGIRKVVEAVGLQEVVDAVGLQKVVDVVGLQKVVDAVGLQKVVDAVGLQKLLDLADKDALEEALRRKTTKQNELK